MTRRLRWALGAATWLMLAAGAQAAKVDRVAHGVVVMPDGGAKTISARA
jgi:hypothetical protein